MNSIADFSNIRVDTLVDENDGDFSAGDVSLREAIAQVSAGGTITFADELLAGNGGVIELSLGALQIDKSVAIKGQNALKLTIKGDQQANVFDIDAGDSDVLLEGLTITDGIVGVNVEDGSVKIVDSAISGNTGNGVESRGTISLATTHVTDNGGNGVEAEGDITIAGGDFSRNKADGVSGKGDIDIADASAKENGDDGISGGGTVTVMRTAVLDNADVGVESTDGYTGNDSDDIAISVTSSLVAGNRVGVVATANDGGSISISESTVANNKGVGVEAKKVDISRTTVDGNDGVGVVSNIDAFIADSTISANKGGGIVSSGKPTGPFILPITIDLKLRRTTVSANGSANTEVGGIYIAPRPNRDTLLSDQQSILENTIVARNTGEKADLSAVTFIDSFNNLIGDASDISFIIDGIVGTSDNPINPLLGELANNGGLTKTHIPLAGSPVIDAGVSSSSLDQRGRGFDRAVDGDGDDIAKSDIGAVEAPVVAVEPVTLIRGTQGDDELDGTDGDNIIKGYRGNDTLRGGKGDDTIYGHGGVDILFGNDGDDTLISGGGIDTLLGGKGKDTFTYLSSRGGGADRIFDFEIGSDLIDLSAILANPKYDSATPFADYVKLGAAVFGQPQLVEMLDIDRTEAAGRQVFNKIASVTTFGGSLDASSFVV